MAENERVGTSGPGLAERLRLAVEDEARDFVPGHGLIDRIEATGARRLRAHRRRRRAATGLAAAAVVAAAVVGVTRLTDDPGAVDVATEGSDRAATNAATTTGAPDVARDGDPAETVTASGPVMLAGVDLRPELVVADGWIVLRLTVPGVDRVGGAGVLELRQYGDEVGSADGLPDVTGSTRAGFGVGEPGRFYVLDGYEVVLLDGEGETIDQVDLPRLTLGEVDTAGEIAGHDLQPRLTIRNNEVFVAVLAPPAGNLPEHAATWSVRRGAEVLTRQEPVADRGTTSVHVQVTELYDAGELGSLRATIDGGEGNELDTAFFGVLLEGAEPTDGDVDQARAAVESMRRQAAELDGPEGLALDVAVGEYGASARVFEQSVGFVEDDDTARELRSQVPLTEQTPLSEYGVGPLRAGMTLADAEEVSGLGIEIDGFGELGTACWYGRVPGQPDLLLQFEPPGAEAPGSTATVDDPADGIISRITVSEPGTTRATADGVRLGDSEADAYAAYDEQLRTVGHKYLPDGHYLFHEPDAAPDHGISYVTDGAVVEEIHVGLRHAIAYVEGCL